MAEPAAGAVVAVHGPGGTPVGLALLVADGALVTCAHVVNLALGRDARSTCRPC